MEHRLLPRRAVSRPALSVWRRRRARGGAASQSLADQTLGVAVRRLIAADFVFCLDAEDRAYYRRSREAAFGCTLEEYCADRRRWLAEFAAVTSPLEKTLASSLASRALRPAMPTISCSRCFSMPDSAAPTSSSTMAPRCVAGATGWCKPSTVSATATRATRRNLKSGSCDLGDDPGAIAECRR